MNLKPFNLERALAGEPVVTRDGTETVKNIIDCGFGSNPVIVEFNDGDETHTYSRVGKFYKHGTECRLDLFMAPVEKTVWVNVYQEEKGGIITGVSTYSTKKEALIYVNDIRREYIGAFPITIKL